MEPLQPLPTERHCSGGGFCLQGDYWVRAQAGSAMETSTITLVLTLQPSKTPFSTPNNGSNTETLSIPASLLTFWSPPTIAQIAVEFVPPIAAESKEVLLLPRNLPEIFSRLQWYRRQIQRENIIASLTTKPENITNGPEYSGRETLYSNGTLLIQNLTKGDTGTYHIQVITVSTEIQDGKAELRVYELLTKPNITANNSSPMEQDSVVLMCESNSKDITYRWFINTQPFQPSAKLQLSPDNKTLTVHHITRNDTGLYECEISNPVSVNRSDPVNLTVLYGPDTPIISPSKFNYPRGGNLSLSCLTASNPPANFSWFMSEKLLGSIQTLSITNLSLNDSGSYSCLVSNSATNLSSTTSIKITVLEPVAQPSIQASNTTVTEGAGPVVLTCLMNDTGVSTRWYLNYKDLEPAERRKLSANNKTLTLQPVMKTDEGNYQCEVSNPISSLKSDSISLQVTSSPGLSAGAIAGIVIGVLAGAALIAALVYFLYVRKTGGASDQRHLTENKLSAYNHSQDHSDNSSNKIEEIAYSSLDFDAQKHRKKQIAESPGPTATETIYSQVKKN